MDEVSIKIENLPDELSPISLHDDNDVPHIEPHDIVKLNSFRSIRSNSPLTMSENSSSDSDNEELRLIRKDRFRNQIQDQFIKKSFTQIEQSLAKYYECDNKYYGKLDILITFMKGQKTLFMQSTFITQKKMYLLMIPVIFFSAAMAIFAPIIQEYSWSGALISALNVIVTFFVSLINYMKFESRAEKYFQLANHYDRLETSLEMASNKIAYIEDSHEKNAMVLQKLGEIELNMNDHRLPIERKAEA